MEVVLGVAGGIVIVGGALAVLTKGVRGLASGVRRLVRMADEVLGDGTDERPGWGKRLAAIESNYSELKETVAGVDRRLLRVEDALTRMPVGLRGDNGPVRRTGQSSMEV